jgi:hypothetical protein
MFDIEIFVNLKTDKDKILYLDNCEETTISLPKLVYSHHNTIHRQSEEVLHSLAKKRFKSENMSILTTIFCREHDNDFKIKILSLYEKNGWFTSIDELTIIHDIVTDEDYYHVDKNDIIDYTIQLYDRLSLPINVKNGWRTKDMDTLDAFTEYGSIKNFIKILKLYLERKIAIDKNIFIKFISCQYYKFDNNKKIQFIELVNLCIANNINCCNKDKLIKWNKIINPLQIVSKCIDDWDCLKKIIDIHLNEKLEINIDNCLLLNIGRNYNLDAIKFIIDYYDKNNQPIDDKFTDKIIQHNSLEILQYVLTQGIIPKNNIIKKYVPCPDCYNGEDYSCNYRNVTTEYIALKRYGKRLNELDKLKEQSPVFFSYDEFDGEANNNEIYTEPGIDILEEYDDDKQIRYRIPPKKVLRE